MVDFLFHHLLGDRGADVEVVVPAARGGVWRRRALPAGIAGSSDQQPPLSHVAGCLVYRKSAHCVPRRNAWRRSRGLRPSPAFERLGRP